MLFFLGLFLGFMIARELFNGLVLVRLRQKRDLEYYMVSYVPEEYRFSAVLFSVFAFFGFVSGASTLLDPWANDAVLVPPFAGLVAGYVAGVLADLRHARRIVSRLEVTFPFSKVLTVTFRKGCPEALFVLLCDAAAALSVLVFFGFAFSSLFAAL